MARPSAMSFCFCCSSEGARKRDPKLFRSPTSRPIPVACSCHHLKSSSLSRDLVKSSYDPVWYPLFLNWSYNHFLSSSLNIVDVIVYVETEVLYCYLSAGFSVKVGLSSRWMLSAYSRRTRYIQQAPRQVQSWISAPIRVLLQPTPQSS